MAIIPNSITFTTALESAINDTTTSIRVKSISGLPTIGANEQYVLIIGSGTTVEQVLVTNDNTSPILTVTRGHNSTTAASWPANTKVRFLYSENYYITDGNKGDITISGNGTVFEVTGGGGSVTSVNGQTGVVVLGADDILPGLTSSVAELNILDGATLTTTELNYVVGVTSSIQTQLDGKAAALGPDDNYVTDAEKVKLSNLSGTNTGDQTSIVGITGTKAQFDTACTDGNFLYVGDVTSYTDEMAQDAIGAMIDSSLNYVDGTPLLQRAALTGDVIASAGSNSTTIANDAVTYAKIQNVSATDKLLGRSSSGAGDVEEITCTTAGRALIDDIDAAAQRTTLGLGTLATQNGIFSGTSSGTNTGDQTSIVGITGTKAQFDTACTDGNFLYTGDITQYTDEMAQDTIASLIQNGTGITWSYDDSANTLTPTITITQYTDELAQDAVGTMIDSSLIYVDSTPLLQRAALTGDVTASAGSNSTTIANSAVTLAKMADVATGTLFYRKTAGTGAPEVNTLATLKTDLGLTGTNSGDQTITLTGDVTGSGTGSFATSIGASGFAQMMTRISLGF